MTGTPDFDVTALVAAIDKAIADRIATAERSPWWTAQQVAERWQCSVKVVYHAIRTGRLKAVTLNGRRDFRVHRDWADDALRRHAEPVPVEVRR